MTRMAPPTVTVKMSSYINRINIQTVCEKTDGMKKLTENVRPSGHYIMLRLHDKKTFALANNLIIVEYK